MIPWFQWLRWLRVQHTIDGTTSLDLQAWAATELERRYPNLRPCGDRVGAGERCEWHEPPNEGHLGADDHAKE